MFMKKLIKKQVSVSLVTVMLLVVAIIGSSYALFQESFSDTNTQSLNLGDLNVAFSNTSNNALTDNDAIDLSDLTPMTDNEAIQETDNLYSFVISNSGTLSYCYTIKLQDNPSYTTNLLSHQYIRFKLNDEEPMMLSETTNGYIASNTINPEETDSYQLRIWVADAEEYNLPNETLGQEVHLNIVIEGEACAPRRAPAPDHWYDSSSSTLLGAIRNTNTISEAWTTPGEQQNYYTDETVSIGSTYRSYYWTYADDYELDSSTGKFNLTGVTTGLYNSSYSNMVGKYIVAITDSGNSSSSNTPKTTTGLTAIYKITETTASSFTYRPAGLWVGVDSTYQNYYWTYGTGFEQVGDYSHPNGVFLLNGVETLKYSDDKADLVGNYLLGTTPADNANATNTAKTVSNITTIYRVMAVGTDYLVLDYPAEDILAATEDDYGVSYYFRGAVNNNFVIFANKCWRIVRIIGDGSIKLTLYNNNANNDSNPCTASLDASGKAYAIYGSSNPGARGFSKYSSSNAANMFVGYMHTTYDSTLNGSNYYTYENTHINASDSIILTNLKTWYDSEFSAAQKNQLADVIWCNDKRVVSDTSYDPQENGNIVGDGAGNHRTLYQSYYRLYPDKPSLQNPSVNTYNRGGAVPSLKCESSDNTNMISRYTSADLTHGNGDLSGYKIGLLTADEVAFAGGGVSLANNKYYLYKNANGGSGVSNTSNQINDYRYWTMSPMGTGYLIMVKYDGSIYFSTTTYESTGVRPAIALNSNVTISGGNGTQASPFVVN